MWPQIRYCDEDCGGDEDADHHDHGNYSGDDSEDDNGGGTHPQ
jgi:hypothetical protein